MIKNLRIATRRDYHFMVRLRAEWLDNFWRKYPAHERWCPACCRVPRIENERTIVDYLPKEDHSWTRLWAVVFESKGNILGYMLCKVDETEHILLIEEQTPRVSPGASLSEVAGGLMEFAIQQASERNLRRMSAGFHGFADEVGPIMNIYREYGFGWDPRYEMLSDELIIDGGDHCLEFLSAAQIGRDAFFAIGAAIDMWPSAEDMKKDCEFSERMWESFDPATDWLVAYDGETPAGIVRVAITREGLGVIDEIGLAREYRGRGLGRCLLARGLSAFVGRVKMAYLDTDQSNIPAVRLYRSSGFRVHHHYQIMEKELE